MKFPKRVRVTEEFAADLCSRRKWNVSMSTCDGDINFRALIFSTGRFATPKYDDRSVGESTIRSACNLDDGIVTIHEINDTETRCIFNCELNVNDRLG